MNLFNASIDYLNALIAILATISPVAFLYVLLAVTYGRAASAAGANNHHSLRRCYFVSAALHGAIGVCHHLHI